MLNVLIYIPVICLAGWFWFTVFKMMVAHSKKAREKAARLKNAFIDVMKD